MIRNLLSDPIEGPHAEALERARGDVLLARTLVLIWISVFVMPTTICGYVAFVAPEKLSTCAAIVGVAVAAVLVQRLAISRGWFAKSPHLAMFLLVGGVFGPTGAAIIELSQGAEASFLFAFFLIYYAFCALFPASVPWMLATCAALMAAYVGARGFRPEGIVLDVPLAIDLIYLSQLSFIGVVLNRVVVSLFFAERKSALELQEANAGLMELDRAKTAFFADVSHELRTPLTLVLTPLKQLLSDAGLPSDTKSVVESATANASRLLKLVNQLLDFAKVEAGEAKVVTTRFDLTDVVTHVGSLFRPAAVERGLELVCTTPPDGLRVVQDLDKIEQMLVNLVGNALKFTPSGTVEIGCRPDGRDVLLWVRDTGRGIPEDARERIFERFAQVDGADAASVRGTGIGLAMVKEYAGLLGGSVSLESELDKGSTFTVRLVAEHSSEITNEQAVGTLDGALAVADLAGPAHAAEPTEVRRGGRPTVLVVDDNPSLVGLVRSILEPTYDLVLLFRGADALARVREGGIDLVVSDVMMPGMSGLELCQALKSDPATRAVPIILLTARGGTAEKIEGLDTGADDYIGKPFDPEELRARVRQLFEVGQLMRNLAERTEAVETAMAELKEKELQLVASERLRTLGDLSAGVFHELHNYLNMIQNGADPLRELIEIVTNDAGSDPELVADIRELTEAIVDASQQAQQVTGQLKGFANQEAPVPRVQDVHDVIAANLRMFGRIPPHIQIDRQLHDGALPVQIVANTFLQVLTNLVRNAMEAMPDGGTVRIRTTPHEDRVHVIVEDDGPGIDSEVADRLFEAFVTSKGEDGLGLGLAMSKDIVETAGGELRLDPTYTDGARFIIDLPGV